MSFLTQRDTTIQIIIKNLKMGRKKSLQIDEGRKIKQGC